MIRCTNCREKTKWPMAGLCSCCAPYLCVVSKDAVQVRTLKSLLMPKGKMQFSMSVVTKPEPDFSRGLCVAETREAA